MEEDRIKTEWREEVRIRRGRRISWRWFRRRRLWRRRWKGRRRRKIR